ncbi:hypothetical protein SAMN05421874_12095 [Nonomuraea maritima]|uniref:Uncharacterized protein n=1 Tax=Nonomuraea maritima TaxID=683260 RepID=A0A1G9JKW5_9ACTN|nr:hypothetical protein SAMN05421874_12095 [Nonomuraea maritima]
MRAVVGDRVVGHVVTFDPVEHLLDELRPVAVPEQAPLGERDGLAALLGELGLRLQPVRLVDVVGEVAPRPLVVGVHADDVDHVVTRVALGPGDRVAPAAGGEVEAELLAGRRAHGRHDAPPVVLPRLRVGRAPAGVGRAVHLPAQHDDRVAGAGRHQLAGQLPEVVVARAVRPRLQLARHRVVGHPGLVGGDHRHVQRQDAAGRGGLPAQPRIEDERRALDRLPSLTRQVGAAHRDLAPEPPLELGQVLGAAFVRGEEDADRRVGAVLGAPLVVVESEPFSDAEPCGHDASGSHRKRTPQENPRPRHRIPPVAAFRSLPTPRRTTPLKAHSRMVTFMNFPQRSRT